MHRNLEPIFFNIHDRKFYRLFTAKNNHTFFEVDLSGGDGESNQDWQDTLIVGSDLTQANIINGGGFHFFWNTLKHFIDQVADATEGNNFKLNIGVATNEGALKIISARNAAHLDLYDTNQPGNGGLDAINIKSYNKDGSEIFWLSGRWLQVWGSDKPTTIANGILTVSTDNTQVTGISFLPNVIQTGNADLVFKYKPPADGDPAVEIAKLSTSGQLRVGSAGTIDASAKLEIDSTTQGLLLPRMTKAQRDAIASPAAGLAIFQTDNTPGLRVFNGTNWIKYSESTD